MRKKLKAKRKKEKVKVRELADLLNLKTTAAYYKKESGKTTITIDEGKLLAKRLNTTMDEIF